MRYVEDYECTGDEHVIREARCVGLLSYLGLLTMELFAFQVTMDRAFSIIKAVTNVVELISIYFML